MHHLATATHMAPRRDVPATPCATDALRPLLCAPGAAHPPPPPAHTCQLGRGFLELHDLLGVRRGVCLHLLGHFEHCFRVLFDLDKMTIDANTVPVIMNGFM